MKNLIYTIVKTYDKGYGEFKTRVCGNWKIFRDGDYVYCSIERCDIWDANKGSWSVSYKDECYGEFATLKEAKQYINNWVSINPKDI